MLDSLEWLALEVVSLDRARNFYEGWLGLDPQERTDSEARYAVGETTLVLRRPRMVPRGGLHVHYAFATGRAGYEEWRERLDDLDPAEFDFGSYRSLYVDDPDGHCVEVGGAADTDRRDLAGVFEVVLEVEALGPAETAYRQLGFEVVDRGDERRRVRLRGPFDLELWEPQLGIADARGGVHADVGLSVADAEAAAAAFGDHAARRERVGGGVRIRDADGHWITFHEG